MDDASEIGQFILGESFAAILTETTQSLVCVFDADARILLFNDACERATGFSREEVVGRDAREFVIPPEEREAFGDFLTYVWKTGTPSPQVGHWRTKAGGRRLIAWSNRPMIGADGAPVALVTTGIDLTDRDSHRDEDDRALQGDPEAKLVEISRLASEQRALRRVATLVAAEVSPERVFTAVSEECARVLQVNSSAVMRFGGDGTATIVGRTNRDNVDVLRVGERLEATESSAVGRVLRTGAPARIDDWGGVRGGEIAEAIFRVGYRSSAAAPIVVVGALWGAVAIASEDPLPADTEDRLGAFCELVSLAVASAQARADLIASRARLVEAGDEQRRRLERNLHDGAQQHLVSVAVKLRVARTQLETRPDVTARLLEESLQRARDRARGAARDRARPASRDPRRARALPRARGPRRPAPGRDRRRRPPRPAARAHRGDGVLHRLGVADQRRQARPGRPRARQRPPRRRHAALRDLRRRPRRRRRDGRQRPRRPARPRRGGGRHALGAQPAGRRHRRHGHRCRSRGAP